MVAAGYMAKRVHTHPDWLGERVADVYSVGRCVSEPFADYMNYWKHNGYWLFDSPEIIQQLAREHAIDLDGTTLFFYEVYELEFAEDERRWVPFTPEAAFPTSVALPADKTLEGYDVVSFYARTTPECSPLSCNGLAREIETNAHCLLGSFERAQALLNDGAFTRSEPGPFRIFAVYSVPWPVSPRLSAA
jgi:hypothetical protein